MPIPNTAQATGPMTLEQGVAHMSAKMAETGVKAEDLVKTKLDEDGYELPEEEPQQLEPENDTDPQETTEAVSTDEPEPSAEELADENLQILLSDGSKVTVGEARKGYLRQAEFTRKTQALASDRDQAATQHAALMNNLAGMAENFNAFVGTEPTPAQMMQLRQQDPQKYADIKAYWDDANKVRTEYQAAQADLLGRKQSLAFRTLNSGEFEPKWKDGKVLKTALENLFEYVIERGVPQSMASKFDNHAIIEIAEESRRYRELQKAKPKAVLAVKGKAAPFRPGSKSTASPQNENIRLLNEAFRNNPSVDNAFALQKAKAGR